MDITQMNYSDDSDEDDGDFNPEGGNEEDDDGQVSKPAKRTVQDSDESDDDDDAGYKAAKQPAYDDDDDDDDEGVTAKRTYDSDDDDDEDEEDEDDSHHRPTKRAKGVSRFIADSAALAGEDDDEDDMDDADITNESELRQLQRSAEARLEKRFERDGYTASGLVDDDDDDMVGRDDRDTFNDLNRRKEDAEVERMHQGILERYGNSNYHDEEEEDYMEGIEEQQALPQVTDPHLFMIKCAPGKEQEVAIQLMRKALDAKRKGKPLGIKSVVGYPSLGVKGASSYIYIEAYKQKQVKEAIDGLDALRYGQYQQNMVAVKDMPAILRVNRLDNKLKPDAWVRVRRGIYANDLARVVKVTTNDARVRVQVQLVPRIDMSTERKERKRSKSHRAPPRLFDDEAIRSALGEDNVEITRTADGHYMFEGNRYVDGFLIKTMPITSLMTEGIKPTLDEITLFEGSVDLAAAADIDSETKFVVGDRVIVTSGDISGLEGTVLKVQDDQILIKPEDQRIGDISEIPVAPNTLRKLFKPADHVKINRGRHEGETGLVIHVGDHDVAILADISMKELKVLARDLEMCESVSAGLDSLGQFSLFNLVQINGATTVGCIIGIDREELKILDQLGNERTVRTQQVQLRNQRQKNQALDKFQNVLSKGSTAKAVEGNNRGKEGKVLHLHRGFVFLQQRTQIEHNGVFVAKARHLQVAGSRASQRAGVRSSAESPRLANKGKAGFNQVARRRPRQHPLLHKTVCIISGPHKTYMGIVKDASEHTVRVELHTNCKTLSVKPSQVKVIAANSQEQKAQNPDALQDGYMAAQTPLYGAATPMYGAATPAYGAQTPRYGSETPRAGNETPGGNRTEYDQNDNAWNPAVPNTPHSNMPDFDDEYDQATTPAGPNSVGASTPAYSSVYGATPDAQAPNDGSTPTAYTPGETPLEPGSVMQGYTPGYQDANTPGAVASWYRPGVYVLFADGSEGTIVDVGTDTCTVEMGDGSRETHPSSDLMPCRPAKDDALLVLEGKHADRTGVLLNIDHVEGVFSVSTPEGGSEMGIVPMQNLVKFNTAYDVN
eukprot:m.163477 g.163477  ORF g.163477 m.163477 type:complete len:1063 (-) comp16551_c0_seq4:1121-4309(-)